MDAFKNKVAVITGAGSGIGLGMARTFAAEGMSVALLDIRGETLAEAARQVRSCGGTPLPIRVDVNDRAGLERAAEAIALALGNVHILCNNGGVVVSGKPITDVSFAEWDWIVGTNLLGEVNVLKAFVPTMVAHGEPGHVVNTASIGGFQVRLGRRTGPYAVTKYGIVALTEALAHDLAGTAIGVSLLAPGAVNTPLRDTSAALDPSRSTPGSAVTPDSMKNGMLPDIVGRRVLAAIRNNDLYIFTHVANRSWLEERHRAIIDAFDATERWARAEGVLDISAMRA